MYVGTILKTFLNKVCIDFNNNMIKAYICFFQGFINLKNDINSNIEFKLSIEANDALKLSGILWKCCIRHT